MTKHTLVVLLAGLAAIAAAGISLSVGLALSRRVARRQLLGLAHHLDAPQSDAVRLEAGKEGSLEVVISHIVGAAQKVLRANAVAVDDATRLRHALDALPQGVVVCGTGAEVKLRNARALSLLDNQSGVLAARAVDEALEESARGMPVDRTIELYGPPKRSLSLHTVPMLSGGRPLGVIAVLEDVSELRRLEAVRRDFVANVSHELKTPVGALGLLAETLVDEEDPVVARHLADRIQTESFRLSRIIDDLLDLSRIEADESPPKEPTEIGHVMVEVADAVRAKAQARGVALAVNQPMQSLIVLADRRQLVSALHNLVDNAIKYTNSDTQVTFSALAGAGSVDLVVSDHGMGIPVRDLDRVFERFYRVDHGRGRETGGTGLGLAIVRHVAHNHAGRVWVESREGEGSTFTLRLPLVSAEIRPQASTVPGPPVPARVGEP